MNYYDIYLTSLGFGQSNDFSGYIQFSKDLADSEQRVAAYMGYEDGKINLRLERLDFASDYPKVWRWFLQRKLSQQSGS